MSNSFLEFHLKSYLPLGIKKSGHTEDTAVVGVRCGKGGKRPGGVEGGLYFHEKAMKAPSTCSRRSKAKVKGQQAHQTSSVLTRKCVQTRDHLNFIT